MTQFMGPYFKDVAWQDAAVSSQALVLRYKISSVPLCETLVSPTWIRWVDMENGTIKPSLAPALWADRAPLQPCQQQRMGLCSQSHSVKAQTPTPPAWQEGAEGPH